MFGSAKYRNYKYGGDDHVAVVHTEHLPKSAAVFVTSAIHKSSYTGKFDYGRNFYAKDADELNISLPAKDGEIDIEAMERFMSDLEMERLQLIEKYLVTSNLKNYELTPDEEKALREYESLEFREFDLVKIFDVKNSGNILSRDIVEGSGDTPYLCASSENNGVSSYISYDDKYIDKGNCVFIGGKTFVVSYQEKDFYSNDSHNLILYLKDEERRTKFNQLFLVACVNKSLGHKYSWGDSISNRKIQKDKVLLPVIDDQLCFKEMETIISAIEKLIAKNLVFYIDSKIETLSRLSNNN